MQLVGILLKTILCLQMVSALTLPFQENIKRDDDVVHLTKTQTDMHTNTHVVPGTPTTTTKPNVNTRTSTVMHYTSTKMETITGKPQQGAATNSPLSQTQAPSPSKNSESSPPSITSTSSQSSLDGGLDKTTTLTSTIYTTTTLSW